MWWCGGGSVVAAAPRATGMHMARARVCAVVQWAAGDVAAFGAFARTFLLKMANRNGKRKRETKTRLRFVLLWLRVLRGRRPRVDTPGIGKGNMKVGFF